MMMPQGRAPYIPVGGMAAGGPTIVVAVATRATATVVGMARAATRIATT